MARRLGSQGPHISEIGLGGWQAGGGATWGANTSDDEIVKVLREGFDEGASWIDTAEVYARGRSEEIVGRAVRNHPDVCVFTKLGPRPDGSGVRADEVAAGVVGSLRRLGREAIDLYQVHWRDSTVPMEETWTAMAALVDRGLVRWIGLSNVSAEDVITCARIRHVDSLQIQGSVLYTDELEWALPLGQRLGMGVLCYGPLGYGLLGSRSETIYRDWRSGTYGMDDFFVAENYERFFSEDKLSAHRATVRQIHRFAQNFNMSGVQLCLAWLLAKPGLTGAITGSRNSLHITENLQAASMKLSKRQLDNVDEFLRGNK